MSLKGVRAAVYDILAADGSVSGDVATRIYLNFAPSATTTPYIEFTYEGIDESFTKDGPSDFDTYRVEVRCYHNTSKDAETLAGYCRTALDGYSGTINGVDVSGIKYQDDEPEADIDLNPYHQIDFQVILT